MDKMRACLRTRTSFSYTDIALNCVVHRRQRSPTRPLRKRSFLVTTDTTTPPLSFDIHDVLLCKLLSCVVCRVVKTQNSLH